MANNINIGDLLGVSFLGFAIVFVVLVLIALIILLMGAIIKAFSKKAEVKTAVEITPVIEVKEIARPPVRLENVDDKTAALAMAIVSNQSKIPLENLAFLSIKLVEEK